MKLKTEETTQEAEALSANPICDIMASKKRARLTLSQEDMETLRRLEQNPPSPTPNLIKGLRQIKGKKTRANNNSAP